MAVGISQSSDHGSHGSHTLVGELAASAQGIVLSLDLLLGVGGLLAGLILDEEDLGLAGGAGLLNNLGLDIALALLAQDIDDGLLLVGGRADLDGLPVVALGRLDEDHVVVPLGHADCDVTLLVILGLLRSGVDEEALRHDGLLLLLLHLLNLLDLLVVLVGLNRRLLVEGLLLRWSRLAGALEECGSTGGRANGTKARRARIVVVALGCGQRHGGKAQDLVN